MKRSSVPARSFRRHQAKKQIRWVMKALPHYFLAGEGFEPRKVGLYSKSPKFCSCWMCGNPRKYQHEVPIQERRAPQSYVDDEA